MDYGYLAGTVDVVVIGGGHAGCEASLAAARMGCRTLMFSISVEGIALMPCNPSVGGPGKGHLVREIDALGGEMALNLDKAWIQIRRLNTGKGPAVRALRAQVDKQAYQREMLNTLLTQDNLEVKQGLVERILTRGTQVYGVQMRGGAIYHCRAVVVTTGTYLQGRIIIGEVAFASGPHGQFPAVQLADNLKELGLNLGRFKTGTPARINRRSVDFTQTIEQPGDAQGGNFSFLNTPIQREQISCWLTYTNPVTHQIILDNLHRAPMYTGFIKGLGPRYCPSIEDKVVRFQGKDGHQVFLEPEGRNTQEMYVQGVSSSLPEEVQYQVLHSIKGLEKVQIIRPAYAIEYDYVPGDQLNLNLETKKIQGLFTAGQINGSSGYEEAAAQGLVAGINAALKVQDREPFLLKRSDGYIGVLVDDLLTKDNWEPYRIMTARAEYRLLLREDNADLRLTELGRKVGLVSDTRWKRFQEKVEAMEQKREWLKTTTLSPQDSAIQSWLISIGSAELKQGIRLLELLRRPEVTLAGLEEALKIGETLKGEEPAETRTTPGRAEKSALAAEVQEELELEVKYAGYIEKQQNQVARFLKREDKKIPVDFDYQSITGLSTEGQQKLAKIRPQTLGQAGRIGGVSPADLSVLLIHLESRRRSQEAKR